jgi:flagellar hook-basal body complex protein FliE
MGISIQGYNNLSSAFKSAVNQNAAIRQGAGAVQQSPMENATRTAAAGTPDAFSQVMNKALEAVDLANKESVSQSTSLLTGQSQNIHDIVIAAEKADIALKMTLQVRNKALEAYQEVMRMQI